MCGLTCRPVHYAGLDSEVEADAGLLLLVIVASGDPVNLTVLGRSVRTGLAALGWRAVRDGAPLDEWRAFAAARNTWTALVRLGALPEDGDRTPSVPAGPAGIQLARAALLRR